MNRRFIVLIVLMLMGLSGLALGENSTDAKLQKATFAGGCFWCMQHPFDELAGVISTTVGYSGGGKKDPTYKEVSAGRTRHAESVEVVYNSSQVDYRTLLDVFWRNIDPTTIDRQFTDIGPQYRTAIFYHDEEQRRLALSSKEELEKSGRFNRRIVTEITSAAEFYKAEEYHQDYYKKHSLRYKIYRAGSGRDRYLEKIWGKSSATQK